MANTKTSPVCRFVIEDALNDVLFGTNISPSMDEVTISLDHLTMKETVVDISGYVRPKSLTFSYVKLSGNYTATFKYYDSSNTLITDTITDNVIDNIQDWFDNRFSVGDEYGFIDVFTIVTLTVDGGSLNEFNIYWDNLETNNIYYIDDYIDFYLLNSEKSVVTKSLTFMFTELIKFNRPITYKVLDLDRKILSSDLSFNYVYIKSLKRYYYVESMILIQEHQILHLVEDVLMSFDSLIRSQRAMVTRNEFTHYANLSDEKFPMEYGKAFDQTTVLPSNNIIPLATDETTRNSIVITVVDSNMHP